MSSLAEIEARFPEKLAFLFEPARYKVLYGGRGGTKSWGAARALLIDGVQQPLRVLCAREFQNSIRDSVHRLLADQIAKLGLSDFYEVQAQIIRAVNGTEFAFEGLKQNVSRIKSYEGVDRVWVEEAEKVSNNSWNVLIPTIRKPGSEIWITFNPEFEDDATYERFVLHPPKSAVVVKVGYQDNPWFPEVLEAERLELKERDPDAYDHVWEGQCRRWLEGAIYSNELRKAYDDNRITEVPFDPEVPVYTAWDLGRTDDTAIWWYQLVSGEIHIIESYAISGGSPSGLASQILGVEVQIDIIAGEVVVTKGDPIPDLEHRGAYEYATHWLPHDAKAKTLAAQGKSTEEQMRTALGYGSIRIVPGLSKEDGILAGRTTFKHCWFDADKCSEGLKALRKYRRELQADDVSLKPSPKHDWTSHYADAFRYLSIAWRETNPASDDKPPPKDTYGLEDETENDWMTV